jgi:hypothetical protein
VRRLRCSVVERRQERAGVTLASAGAGKKRAAVSLSCREAGDAAEASGSRERGRGRREEGES